MTARLHSGGHHAVSPSRRQAYRSGQIQVLRCRILNSNYLALTLQQNGLGGGGSAEGIAVYSIKSDGTVGAPTPFLNLITSDGVPGASSFVWDSSGKYVFASAGGTIYVIRFDSTTNTLALAGSTTSTTGTPVRSFHLCQRYRPSTQHQNSTMRIHNLTYLKAVACFGIGSDQITL
jgi:hypothetical protein